MNQNTIKLVDSLLKIRRGAAVRRPSPTWDLRAFRTQSENDFFVEQTLRAWVDSYQLPAEALQSSYDGFPYLSVNSAYFHYFVGHDAPFN